MYAVGSFCKSMFSFVSFSMCNVIRPPLGLDQEHLSTVEVIFSLATAAVGGYS